MKIKIFFLILWSLSPDAFADDALPFWKSKPEVYRRMKEERYIAVSAKNENVGSDKKLTVLTAGVIHAPENFTEKEINDFGNYSKILPYILESSFDKSTNNVFIHGAFLGYHVQMTVHVVTKDGVEGQTIQWNSIAGSFIGMKGNINVTKMQDADHTETSLDANYIGKTLNIPGFILDWGLEFAAHRAASAMRTQIESDWEKSKKH